MRKLQTMQSTCALIGLFLSLCACGVSSSGFKPGPTPPSPSSAPSDLTYAVPSATYPVGLTISSNKPASHGGAVTGYTVAPTLPWGLSLDSTSGVISGIPTVAAPQSPYVVTAYNAAGSTTATLSITVTNGAPTRIAYSDSAPVYTVNAAIMVNVPSVSGGAPTGYVVKPDLPAGLNLNLASGTISGTPTAVSPAAFYKIIASNAFGNAAVKVNITVEQANGALVYSPSTVVFTMGRSITPLAPSHRVSGTYTIEPPLPAGLSLNSSSGIITGTPTAVTLTQTYTVTASTPVGNAFGTLSLTVDARAPWAQTLPNLNQTITPLAPAGSQFQQLNPDLPDYPSYLSTHAATTAVSPDGGTLLVLTSGYNRVFNQASDSLNSYFKPDSYEHIFVYDISRGTPIKKQVLQVPISYFGIAWDPTTINTNPVGNNTVAHFYVTGCTDDDVHIFSYDSGSDLWQEENLFPNSTVPKLELGHNNIGVGLNAAPNVGSVPVNSQVYVYPCAAGIALSHTGTTMAVANYFNDSLSVLKGGYGKWLLVNPEDGSTVQPGTDVPSANLDLRPGKSLASAASGTPGGEYPFWVLIAGNEPNTIAYVSSMRDREIDVVPLNQYPLQVTVRIPVKGQPNKMVLNRAQTLLYVAEDQSDTVDVIDIDQNSTHNLTVNTVIETIPVLAPAGLLPSSFYYSNSNQDIANPIYSGSNTNSLTLAPDEKQLYVTNGNLNNVAVVQLTGTNSGDRVIGLIPTGWYPNSVSLNAAGTWMYVANAKSPTGPDPDWCYGYGPTLFVPNCFASNQYNPERTKAGLQSFPLPNASQLKPLTAQVARNNRFSSTESGSQMQVMAAVHRAIKHVIYILKENRTYDQVLGDLVNKDGDMIGDGDPDLVQWGEAITPNLHNLARSFVTLDHFFASSEVSVDGWLWSTAAQCPDIIEHEFPVVYAYRGLSLDSEGLNRSVNVGLPTLAERRAADPLTPNDPDVLPGQTDAGAPDGPNDEVNTGYLWDAAMRSGLSVRNYGFFVDTTCYNEPACQIPVIHDPAASNTVVAYPTNADLAPYTDPYYRGFDNNFPDYYRFKEWERDFDANYANGGLPALTLVRMMHDHTGSFDTATDMVNTPELMQADNDYAVGLLVQKIANSIYAENTLIFVVEDDAQDGADHLDSHRTIAFIVGPYVKQGAVVSTSYTTIDFIRTMEEVLGIRPFLNLNDALGHPMSDVFTTTPQKWTFTASPSAYLYGTALPLPTAPAGMKIPKSTHDAAYWTRVTRGLDFSDADRVDPLLYNRILWNGMMHGRPYPSSLQKAHDKFDEHNPRQKAEIQTNPDED
jgi:DNA-binding beta-propeller fold protein YncE